MAISNIPKVVVKYYLNRYPPRVRLTQFNFLTRWSWMLPILEEIKPELFPPKPGEEAPPEAEEIPAIAPPGLIPAASPYKQYRCRLGDPLNCTEPLAVMGRETKDCRICGFPATIAEKTEIFGRRGTYRVVRCLGRRGRGRLYDVVQTGTEQPMVLKEYLLPRRYFNAEEMRQRQEAFIQLAGVALADGRSQDFRVIVPWEAIADDREERCYLVTPSLDAKPTLNQVLAVTGALSAPQVHQILNQVLQTLEFLHQQKYSLPMGQVQTGLLHGNLTLDSLLVVKQKNTTENEQESWKKYGIENGDFIYLSDLLLWERLFEPYHSQVPDGSVAQDLMAIGQIAFSLLMGKTVNDEGQPLNPKDDHHWQGVYPPLRNYVRRLLELDLPFETATDARKALLKLPNLAWEDQLAGDAEVLTPKKPFPKALAALIMALLLAAFGKLAMVLLVKPAPAAQQAPPICCMKEVGGMPAGEFTYTAVEDGIWSKFLQQTGLAGVPGSQKLKEYLATTQPQLKLNYQPVDSVRTAIARVRSGKAAFAVIPLARELPDDLAYDEIAFDALAVFVNFSYSEREKGLPTALNGQLTLKQLRQIYMGEIQDWQAISNSHLPIKRYAPLENESINLFEQKVLSDPRAIALFRQQTASPKDDPDEADTFIRDPDLPDTKIEQLPTMDLLRASIQDFELKQTGGIGIAPFSQVFGQCSVYPLALSKDRKPPVQALVLKKNGKAIDPAVDLCDRKGSYTLVPDLVRTGRYPLGYAIAIIYTRDNSRAPVGEKFAEMLKSTEGQTLLGEFGLIPLQDKPKSP
ncbi:MAG: substrate-binding domain-containing protein [Oculatellaceae cyanobacterium Prado106]|nr:substrate-binding domain-containing protein [Oculatellaceae cyanobacterium Prado106]